MTLQAAFEQQADICIALDFSLKMGTDGVLGGLARRHSLGRQIRTFEGYPALLVPRCGCRASPAELHAWC